MATQVVRTTSKPSDDFLSLWGRDPVPWIEHNHSDRLSVRKLELLFWDDWEKIGDSIAELSELTHLYIQYCKSLKYLPNSIVQLSKLSTLQVKGCDSLEALPPNLNVVELRVKQCCRLQNIPPGLNKLQHLKLQLCSHTVDKILNFMDAKTPRKLTISMCQEHPVKEFLTNWNEFVNLETLIINASYMEKLPPFTRLLNLQKLRIYDFQESGINLDEMPQLLLLDIRSCENTKYLSLSQQHLLNLRFLFLPEEFILETLPVDLNNSCIIHVENRHIRKTWKEIKQEIEPLYMGASQPLVMEATQNHSPLHPSGYLSRKGVPSTWIPISYYLSSFVRILDLELPFTKEILELPYIIQEIGGVIGALPNLTHLYISGCYNLRRCLRDSTARLTHLSLYECDLKSLCDTLCKLSNLKSLDLSLEYEDFPASLGLPFFLEHLTLRFQEYSLPDSVAKLSNLNTLELWNCREVLIPENLNLNKLKLVKSSVESLPTSICHLEIVHDGEYGDDFCNGHSELCLKELVNLKTLSLTYCRVINPPTIAGPHFLQTLEFKDCVNLRELMPNLIEFKGLCTLDVSCTRIKSLPECITNLPNLKHLILPKCFRRRNLPNQFLRKDSIVKIEFDTTDEYYYKKMVYDYESSTEASDEENEITPGSVVGLDELQGRESREDGIFNVHTSSQMPNPSEANQGVVAVDFQISEWNFSTGENSHHATHCLQNQEMENLSSGLHSVDNAKDITRSNSEFQETINFYENRQMEPMNLENVVAVTSFDQLISGASAHDVNNHDDVVDPENNNNPDGGHKKGNKQKIEIHRDQIQSLRDEHISLVEAAKKLGVSRSTMKRRCKELGLGEWPSSKQKKSDSTKKRRITTKSPPRGEPSQPNLVECSNPAGPDTPEYALECLELNQHNSSEQEVPESNFIDHTTANATTDCVEDLNVATYRHVNVHESVPECTVGTGGHSLLGNVQESLSSSSFDIKATYKDDMVRFKWLSTASLEELKKAVVENLEIELGSFKLKYQDEEDDWLLIKSSEHLERAFTSIKNNILRLKVIDL